jgi:MATE family multidrug resistance protein
VNIGCYYIVGVPLGALLGFVFKLGVKVLESHALTFLLCTRLSTLNTLLVSCWQGIWGGMIGGTVMQTAILLWVTLRTDWSKEVAITESYRRKDKIFVSILHQVSHS